MDYYFTKNFTGTPFQIFYPPHLIALTLILLLNLGFVYFRRVESSQARQRVRYAMATILILNEIGWHLWHIFTGQWTIQTMLPLHVCSVLVFLGAAMLITRNDTLYEVQYLLGIGGAIQAVLTPDVGLYGFPHFRFFQTFISHGLIISSAIYMTVVEGYRPTVKSLWRVFWLTNVYMIFVGLVNWAMGSNYMFIARKPDTPSLIDVLGPWPLYIIWLEVIGLATVLILYSPFAIKDWAKKMRNVGR